ncbi:36792_t:CDS:1, partial [Racocetra persica]
LPDEHYFLNLDELQKHKELLQELEKYEPAMEKLDKSGGYAAFNIQFYSKKQESTTNYHLEQNMEDDTSNNVPTLPRLRSGSSALAKFLSVEDDSYDELTNR